MTAMKVQIIKKNGKKEYAVMPYEDFLRIQEELDDYENLRCLRDAKKAERDAPTLGLEDVKKRIGLSTKQ